MVRGLYVWRMLIAAALSMLFAAPCLAEEFSVVVTTEEEASEAFVVEILSGEDR